MCGRVHFGTWALVLLQGCVWPCVLWNLGADNRCQMRMMPRYWCHRLSMLKVHCAVFVTSFSEGLGERNRCFEGETVTEARAT